MPPDATRTHTRQRRQLQPLWNALDRVLGPHMADGVLLAVSGGPDSRALLESAARWRGRFAGALEVATLDHGVRPEAAAEVESVVARARVLGFDAAALRVAVGTSGDEASLREARYRALSVHASCRGLAAIATAHHADDDAEGYLMHLLGWGGGPAGAAMAAASARGPVTLLRPFLTLARADLALALSALGIGDALCDPHDARRLGQRAQVRLRLVPALRALRPAATGRLAALARRARDDESSLRAAASHLLQTGEEGAFVHRAACGDRALARRALELAIARLAPADPRGATRAVEALLEAGGFGETPARVGRRFDVPGGRAEVLSGGVWVGPVGGSPGAPADPHPPGCPARNGDA